MRPPLPQVLVAARRRQQLSQRQLAARAGVSLSTLSRYESGRAVPTLDVVERLLAGCDLEMVVTLDALTQQADDLIERMLTGEVDLRLDQLHTAAAGLAGDLEARPMPGVAPHRTGPVTWAFDRATALALHGFAADQLGVDLVVVWDEAAQWWLTSLAVRVWDDQGRMESGWLDLEAHEAEPLLRGLAMGFTGPMRIRVVTALPPTIEVHGLPVVRLDEVERAHPEWSDALARLRARGG